MKFQEDVRKSIRLPRNTTLMSIILVMIVLIFVKFFGNFNSDLINDGSLQVSFINVGQGDSILIKNSQDEFILIDTGVREQYDSLSAYLNNQKITKFEYVIFTHPHADHIGSADRIIKDYDVETLIMPVATTNTMTFTRLMEEIEAKNLLITPAEAGDEYIFGDVRFIIVAPVKKSYDNLNDYSVVIKMIHGNNSFLLTGDIEKTSEDDIMDYWESHGEETISADILKADILKIAHHGSSTSSSQLFLNFVNPETAVILTDGKSYGHPHPEVLDRLFDINAAILQSNLHGNILITSDGTEFSIETEKNGD